MNRSKIEYPCEWEYKIIVQDEKALQEAVSEIFKTKQYTLSFSNISKAGKYISFSLKTAVATEEERNEIFVSLRRHHAIRSVI